MYLASVKNKENVLVTPAKTLKSLQVAAFSLRSFHTVIHIEIKLGQYMPV